MTGKQDTHYNQLVKMTSVETDECILWPHYKDPRGYGRIRHQMTRYGAHQLSCLLHHGERPTPMHHAAHSCNNPSCVNPRHLRWATPKENSADRDLHGTTARAERSGSAKLTVADVAAMRQMYANGASYPEMSRQFNVHETTVWKVVKNRHWQSVEPAPVTSSPTKTHCRAGHPYAGDNLAFVDGKRLCKTCRRESFKRFDEKRRPRKKAA